MSHTSIFRAVKELDAVERANNDEGVVLAGTLKIICSYLDAHCSLYFDCRRNSMFIEHSHAGHIDAKELDKVAHAIKNEPVLVAKAQQQEHPRIINNLHHCREFSLLSALSHNYANHLLLVPLRYRQQTYAVIYILRHKNQTVFLERDREFAFSIALYLCTLRRERTAYRRAVYPRHVSTNILQRTYTDFNHYRHIKQIIDADRIIVGLVGESGVGKTHFAEYVHMLGSPPRSQMMIVDCSWLVDDDVLRIPNVETIATVLVLHIDSLNPQNQKNLIENLKGSLTNEVKKRKIFVEISASQYLKSVPDVIQHLVDDTIFIEPLRKNPTQLMRMVRYLLSVDKKNIDVGAGTERQLTAHTWNENMKEFMYIYNYNKTLPENQTGELNTIDFLHFDRHYLSRGLKEAVEEYRKNYIISVLQYYCGNQTYAAKALNIQRTYLNKLLQKWHKKERGNGE